VYRSQALQHHLSFLRLPPDISLGDVTQRDKYRQVSVTLPPQANGREIRKTGEAILYAATIPKNARNPELAAQYLSFLLSAKGRAVLTDQYLAMMDVPWTNDRENVPDRLRDAIKASPTSSPPGGASQHSRSVPSEPGRSGAGASDGQ
jgi:molybdate/tungstate transport system substrate-binding protein